jgi:hypothetical protein
MFSPGMARSTGDRSSAHPSALVVVIVYRLLARAAGSWSLPVNSRRSRAKS